jgi:hypothetical protein
MHPAARETATPPADALIARLDQGIMELNENLAHLRQHIAELDHMSAASDPLLQTLRALDLAAWRLPEQQWQLQLEHLKLTSDHIHRAQETRLTNLAYGMSGSRGNRNFPPPFNSYVTDGMSLSDNVSW